MWPARLCFKRWIVYCDTQHVPLNVPLKPETKDSINKELLVKMPNDATLINAACPDRDT